MSTKRRVYMNHNIKGSNPFNDPVVTVDDGRRVMYVNEVDFLDNKGKVVLRLRTGRKKGSAGHKLKAWIETDLKVNVR